MTRNWKEKDFEKELGHWITSRLRDGSITRSFPYETKVSKGGTLPFARFETQQLRALEMATKDGWRYKISDSGMGKKPCDGVVFSNAEAYVFVMFHVKERARFDFFQIPIAYMLQQQQSGKKSIQERELKPEWKKNLFIV